MTHDRAVRLWQQRGDEQALAFLLNLYKPLIKWCSHRRAATWKVDFDIADNAADLIVSGLIKSHDPSKGRLSTMIRTCLPRHMGIFCVSEKGLPAHFDGISYVYFYRNYYRLKEELKRNPYPNELAAGVGCKESGARLFLNSHIQGNTYSIYTEFDEEESCLLDRTVIDCGRNSTVGKNPSHIIEDKYESDLAIVMRLSEDLPASHKRLIQMRLQGHIIRECANDLKISPDMATQILSESVEILKSIISGTDPPDIEPISIRRSRGFYSMPRKPVNRKLPPVPDNYSEDKEYLSWRELQAFDNYLAGMTDIENGKAMGLSGPSACNYRTNAAYVLSRLSGPSRQECIDRANHKRRNREIGKSSQYAPSGTLIAEAFAKAGYI